MDCIIVNGECPACALENIETILELNTDDRWECPHCQIQYQGVGKMDGMDCLGMLDERGNGNLKDNYYKATDHIKNFILLRTPLSEVDDCIIRNEQELREYINYII